MSRPACIGRSWRFTIEQMSSIVPTTQSIRGDNPTQYGAILADLHGGGLSYRAIARRHGVGASTVGGIARREGIARPNGQQIAAAAIHRGYHLAERVRLLDEALFAVEVGLETCDTPADLERLVSAMSSLVRMRRFEEDTATAGIEMVSAAVRDEARASLAAKLEGLARLPDRSS
jgi:hypothetical protein